MQLQNSFIVPTSVDEAWRVLTDVEQIAPCMPGATLDSVDGDDFTGRVKVKLGPINLTYAGKASFLTKDEATHRAVIDARGKDQRGNGTAAAVVTATLAAEGTTTRVDVLTELNITGRPAQFGRGVMVDVGNKLLGQFADRLAAQLGEPEALSVPATPQAAAAVTAAAPGAVSAPADVPATPVPAPSSSAPSPSTTSPSTTSPSTTGKPAAEPAPIDLLDLAGGAAFRRLGPAVAAALGVLLAIAVLVRRRRR